MRACWNGPRLTLLRGVPPRLRMASTNSTRSHRAVRGPAAAGTTVTLSGAAVAATTTSAGGVYSFTDLAKGNYTVTVSHSGFTFNPASEAAAVTTANRSEEH